MGVFICKCGDGEAGILDVEALVETAGRWPGVAYAGHAPYWCSVDGRERLQAITQSEGLEGVVVAGCSPRTHRRLFQETVAQAGLNPDLLGLVNIREGCAWPHRAEPGAATLRARDQIEMEVAHTAALTLRPPAKAEIATRALVIGAGMTGMTAALELAGAGIPVTLVERGRAPGGRDSSNAPELVANLIAAVQRHPDINLHLDSHLARLEGSVGAYHISITNHAARATHHGPFGAIIVATGLPDEDTGKLAGLLRLPQDAKGYLSELRVRLRPERHIERGIYICGSVHYPCDAARAQFQAYSAASRALRHLGRRSVTARGPGAQVDPEKCNGCSDCFQVCPFGAVTMVERSDRLNRKNLSYFPGRLEPGAGLSLSVIDPLLCAGCGNCVSICPVGAATMTGWTDAQLEAQMQVALRGEPKERGEGREPRILIFACEWSGYAAIELAGRQQLTYPANVRTIRLDCSGRLQPGLILKAFEMGAAGVLVLGCAPRLCHYERGNERAAATCSQVERLAGLLGLGPARLQLAWTAPDDGPALAELVTRFVKGVGQSRWDDTEDENEERQSTALATPKSIFKGAKHP